MPKRNDCIDLYKILNLNIKIKIIQKIESPDIYQLLNTPMSYIPTIGIFLSHGLAIPLFHVKEASFERLHFAWLLYMKYPKWAKPTETERLVVVRVCEPGL